MADCIAISFAFPISAKRFKGAAKAATDYDPLSQAAFQATIPETEASYH
jgi:hypothetical protein